VKKIFTFEAPTTLKKSKPEEEKTPATENKNLKKRKASKNFKDVRLSEVKECKLEKIPLSILQRDTCTEKVFGVQISLQLTLITGYE